jgi:hypothetical protein
MGATAKSLAQRPGLYILAGGDGVKKTTRVHKINTDLFLERKALPKEIQKLKTLYRYGKASLYVC